MGISIFPLRLLDTPQFRISIQHQTEKARRLERSSQPLSSVETSQQSLPLTENPCFDSSDLRFRRKSGSTSPASGFQPAVRGRDRKTEVEEMTGARMPAWKERENNMRRERRRRAIATKIYAGLRMYGNYKLPKHCDNNEVLKALCKEVGWIVEEDGTTYRKGCKPVDSMDITGNSVSVSQSSSYQPSSRASYNASPSSSSIPSPSHYINANSDANSLIPWLKNLSSNSSSPSPNLPYLYIPGGCISAPVTPPLSSPTCTTPRGRNNTDQDNTNINQNYSLPSSTPPSPGRRALLDPSWLAHTGPNSPTFSLVSPNPFGFRDEPMVGGGSRMWTPGQSDPCSPAVAAGYDHTADVPMCDGIAAEFAFGSGSTMGLVKAWEGERIHEECAPDDLELKL